MKNQPAKKAAISLSPRTRGDENYIGIGIGFRVSREGLEEVTRTQEHTTHVWVGAFARWGVWAFAPWSRSDFTGFGRPGDGAYYHIRGIFLIPIKPAKLYQRKNTSTMLNPFLFSNSIFSSILYGIRTFSRASLFRDISN